MLSLWFGVKCFNVGNKAYSAVIIATLMLILAPMAGAKFAYDKDEGTVADILLESIWFYASVAAIYTAILVISGLTW